MFSQQNAGQVAAGKSGVQELGPGGGLLDPVSVFGKDPGGVAEHGPQGPGDDYVVFHCGYHAVGEMENIFLL